MRHYFVELIYIFGLNVEHVVDNLVVLKVPDVDPEVVGRDEVLSIGSQRQGIDMILVGISILSPCSAFPALIDDLRSRDHELSLLEQFLAALVLLLFLILYAPELDQLVVRCEHLWHGILEEVHPLNGVDLLRDRGGVERVEGCLVGLELGQVVEVGFPIFLYHLENYDAPSSVSN